MVQEFIQSMQPLTSPVELISPVLSFFVTHCFQLNTNLISRINCLTCCLFHALFSLGGTNLIGILLFFILSVMYLARSNFFAYPVVPHEGDFMNLEKICTFTKLTIYTKVLFICSTKLAKLGDLKI